jgi:hypothetical protein
VPAAGGGDEGLTERMGEPGGAGAGFEGDAGLRRAPLLIGLEQRINPQRAGKPVSRALVDGWVPFLLISILRYNLSLL